MLQRGILLSQLTNTDIRLYKETCALVWEFQQSEREIKKSKKVLVNCHSFARAIAFHIKELQVTDGCYRGMTAKNGRLYTTKTEHSWLTTPDGCIIEPYAIGFLSASPVLIPTTGKLTHAHANCYTYDRAFARIIRKKVLDPVVQEKIKIAKERLSVCLEKIRNTSS